VLVAAANSDANILDVAIIGSGPGGLSAALALSKNHNRVAVYEKASAFRPIGAALGLHELGYAALESLGIAELVRAGAANPKHNILQRPNGEILNDDESVFYNTPFTWLGWYTLQSALRESLPEHVNINLQHKLVDIEEDDKNGLVKLSFQVGTSKTKKVVLARTLVGADGYHSIVRRHTVNDGHPNYTGTMTWRGVLDRKMFTGGKLGKPFHTEDESGMLSVIGDKKNFIVMDCGSGQIAWTGTALQENAEKSESAQQSALDTFQDWPSVVGDLIRATNADDIIESGVYDRNSVDSWGVSCGKFKRVTLLGDAAHAMRPSLGLGSTMAFQDALSLAKNMAEVSSLDNSNKVADAIKSYEKERIEITSPLQAKARVEGERSHSSDQAEQMKQMIESAIAKKLETVGAVKEEL